MEKNKYETISFTAIMCEIHSGTFCLSWIWILFCTGCQPARPGIYCRRRSALDYSLDGLGRPGWRLHSRGMITRIHTLLYYSLSFWVEARVTDSAGKVEEKRYLEKGNYLEVNNWNSSLLHSKCRAQMMTALKRWRQRTCMNVILLFLRCTWFLPNT